AEEDRSRSTIALVGHAAESGGVSENRRYGRRYRLTCCLSGAVTVRTCSDPKRGRKFGKMTSAVATQFLPVVAAASATKDYLVISIHDVAPATQIVCDKIISELARKGVRHCSLLVVPDYHHQGESMQDRQFVSWLRG